MRVPLLLDHYLMNYKGIYCQTLLLGLNIIITEMKFLYRALTTARQLNIPKR
ncbi:MAG: hypothetical protein K0Q79_697 [Flavipsychrobacter sp.]|jgi:hypothetical protein|nr:hypothetical protein [Flavipsychrobacter sp.]